MSTPTPRADSHAQVAFQSGGGIRFALGRQDEPGYMVSTDFARTLERELSESRNAERLARVQLEAEREKVRVLRSACESICEEWGRNHDAPFCAGQRMETLASKALEELEDAT